jgi:hypothetical protein
MDASAGQARVRRKVLLAELLQSRRRAVNRRFAVRNIQAGTARSLESLQKIHFVCWLIDAWGRCWKRSNWYVATAITRMCEFLKIA